MGERLYLKVFGNVAEYFGLFSDDSWEISPETKENVDGAKLHCFYVAQDLPDGCDANCAYCTQGYNSTYKRKEAFLINKYLIKYPMERLVDLGRDGFFEKRDIRRICISAFHNKNAKENALKIIRLIRSVSPVAITVNYIPDTKEGYAELKEAGADRLSINIEVATEELFEKIRGKYREHSPYTWEIMNEAIDNALDVYGPNNIGTHLLIGLGETHEEALRQVQSLYDRKVDVSLFAFRSVPDTDLGDRASVEYKDFHKVQLGRYLMLTKKAKFEDMGFNDNGAILDYGIDNDSLMRLVNTGKPFRNGGGCPNCNRIFYETDVKQRNYNYPRDLHQHEIDRIKAEIFS